MIVRRRRGDFGRLREGEKGGFSLVCSESGRFCVGGYLGGMARTLSDVIAENDVPGHVSAEDSASDVVSLFTTYRIAAACIRGERSVRGIITVRDIVKLIARREDLDMITVADFMTTDPVVLPADASTEDAVAVMRAGGFRHVPVVDKNGSLLGVIDALELVYDAIISMQNRFIPTRRAFSFFRNTTLRLQEPTVSSIGSLRYLPCLPYHHPPSPS